LLLPAWLHIFTACSYNQSPLACLLLLLLLLLLGMLDLIAGALQAEGIPFVRVDGKSSAKARKGAIQAFAGDRQCLCCAFGCKPTVVCQHLILSTNQLATV
jgi:hypothetical protein